MKESTLLKIALITAIIGIISLFLISQTIEIEAKTINKITSEDIEKDIRIAGYISKCDDKEKVMYLKVAQAEMIDVIVFKDSTIEVKENDYIEATGTIEEYNGKMQLIANEIKIK